MANQTSKYAGLSKEQMFDILRREILAARLKITLDMRQGRTTPPEVQGLAAMELPPARWAMPKQGRSREGDHGCSCAAKL
ncbi:hypothetical protein ACHABX_13545 [Nesterenkonia halotolerans]|uniref:hypothetical protein n=1 Tax=Nesterenkonia halotolerans TaxID=225325 RepID=UPI003EE56471